MSLVLGIMLMILLSNCILAENIKKEEVKDYVDQEHKVELENDEFEEQCNLFYESGSIENQVLQALYEG